MAAAAARSAERVTTSGTKAIGTRQVLRMLPLATTGQPGCKQQQSYSAFYHTEATLDLFLLLASYKRHSTILASRCQSDLTVPGMQT